VTDVILPIVRCRLNELSKLSFSMPEKTGG
jgi:hypothetical protein